MTSAPTSRPTTNIPVAIPAGAPSGPPVAGPRTIAGSIPGARSIVSRLLHGTPGRMRLFGVLGVLAAIVLGAVSANALLSSQAAVERAANNTAQVVRAQSIHVDLLRADAVATNAFLIGGLESPESRDRYQQAMSRVASGIAEAAAAQPADGTALGALSQQVQTYTALVEQARTNNRLGLPVGAQYLTQASAGLRADAIPIITAIVDANEQRAQDEFTRSNSSLQLAVGLVALIGLVVIAVWLARRTHRYLNGRLTAAIALLLAALVFTFVQVAAVGSATRAVADGSFGQTVTLAEATTAANDARANESLTLIRRGSGASNEASWKADDTAVRNALSGVDDESLADKWGDYTSVHEQVRELDDNGQWEQAVAMSTDATAKGSDGTFTIFDTAVTQARDAAGKAAVERLDGLAGTAPVAALGVALAALLAAWLVVRGIGQRIEEYR
ncbi:hypothetical protein [Humibacillus xanthopallidus]|uniref:hypothetical protein n=1 Tax=Humibacillus xanthopallidus TaxID=412689 RepID=UPI0038514D8F